MSSYELMNAILRRSWDEAKHVVNERPELVYVNSYPGFDYIDLDGHHHSNNHDNDNEQEGEVHARSRSPLHELCRQISQLSGTNNNNDDEESSSSDRWQMYELARAILRASHCSLNRKLWKEVHPDSMEKSILEFYEGDARDQTPLHVLCSLNVDSKMLSIICESIADPSERRQATILPPYLVDLLKKPNRLGCTPLHYLAENRGCPNETLERILRLAHESRPTWLQLDTNEEDVSGLENQSTMTRAMLATDEDGENPMHWALVAPIRPAPFRSLMLYGGRETLWRTNIFGEFPMELFARSCQEDLHVSDDESVDPQEQNYRVFEEYLSVAEECCNLVEDDSDEQSSFPQPERFPVHLMASSVYCPCPRYFIELALQYRASDFTKYDNTRRGMLPIHLALLAPCFQRRRLDMCDARDSKQVLFNNESIVLKILEIHGESANLPSREGRLALHYAVESGMGVFVIEQILQKYPEALSQSDPLSSLMPCLLAAVEENTSLDVVYLLIRSSPSNIIA